MYTFWQRKWNNNIDLKKIKPAFNFTNNGNSTIF